MNIEVRFFSYYKKIRNYYRKFNPYSIFNNCLLYLYSPVATEIDQLKKRPWELFLLIKWIYSDPQVSQQNKNIDFASFEKLRIMMYDIPIYIAQIEDYFHLDLFFRNLAYQQFVYQNDIDLAQILRQKIFINFLQNNHPIITEFEKKIGIRINDFSELSVILMSQIRIDGKHTVPETYFNQLIELYDKKKIKSFWSSISVSLNELKGHLQKYSNQSKRKSSEFYELSPFVNFPLIKYNNSYICVNPHLLFRCLETFVYDKLRSIDSSKFTTDFGRVFEKYLEKTISYSGVSYLTEHQLIKKLKIQGKVIDFLILEDKANIFIDAKAIEMSYNGKYSYDKIYIERSSKDKIIKAIEQAVDTNYAISKQKSAQINSKENNYLLIVTYKQLFLGNGLKYYNNVDNKKIDKIYSNYNSNTIIPLKNIYFITISEFDRLFEYVKLNNKNIGSLLDIFIKDDLEQKSTKFHFSQHLNSLNIRQVPSFLYEEHKKLVEKTKPYLL
ncbi:MAG: hypothetical protein JW870_01050 [Candidatus Delongbacteria bacterium]|nr:hypothetical protein [Candidatus Delongbacteria bacterium]